MYETCMKMLKYYCSINTASRDDGTAPEVLEWWLRTVKRNITLLSSGQTTHKKGPHRGGWWFLWEDGVGECPELDIHF